MEAQSEHVHVACASLHVLAPTCMLSRCLLTKFSASELRRKLIKSALSVGKASPHALWCCVLCVHGRVNTREKTASVLV